MASTVQWRMACPRGHVAIELDHDAGSFCKQCAANGWPSYHREVVDQKTGERLTVPAARARLEAEGSP